jgi:hypothetical protein
MTDHDGDDLLARGREVQAQLWPQVASGPTGAFPAAKLAPDLYRYVAVEVLSQTAVYAGVPAANEALKVAAEVFDASAQ